MSKHLRVLREHGVIRSHTEGTRRLYSVDDAGLAELDAWISRFWTNRLDHRGLPPGAIAGYGAGWHSHLDSLEAHLAGGEADCSARFAELGPEYEREAEALVRG